MLSKLKYCFYLLLLTLVVGCNDDDDSSTTTSNNTFNGFQLSGRILVASNISKDDDVNDVRTVNRSNNTLESAQLVQNPLILGGYVNRPHAGPEGHFQTTGDINDFYRVELRAQQQILLFVASDNLVGNDIDLILLDSEGFVLDLSLNEGETESLIVPENGQYFIQVHAESGASNYVLSIGQNIATTALLSDMRLSHRFVANEVIVQLSPHLQTQSFTHLGLFSALSQDTSRRMRLSLDSNQFNALSTSTPLKFRTPEQRKKYETLLAIKQLRRQKDFIEVSPNYQLQMLRVPNDDLYRYQWNHRLMNLPQAWNTTIGSTSVVVAVVDTGVLPNHPDLKGKFVDGYDFVSDRSTELDFNRGIDSDPTDPGDQLQGGSSFHGTHVAGTIAAVTDNEEGIAGISWLTRIMPLRVLGKEGIGSDYDIEQAVRYAAGLSNDSGTTPKQPADIINLSLGGPIISSGFQQLMTLVRNRGIIVIAAAGNDGDDTPVVPAALEGVISVGAVDMNKQRASYSNFGFSLDVMAPGGDYTPDLNGDGMPDGILSTMGHEPDRSSTVEFSYSTSVGTSMAAPHIAGVISLMKAVNPDLTTTQFYDLLQRRQLTEELGPLGRDDYFGYGLINGQKAVLAAIELAGGQVPEPSPPLLVVSPNSLNFGLDRTRTLLTLSNGGEGELVIENITENSGGFLTIAGNNQLGDYLVTVDRSGLNIGTFTATITIITNVNTVKVPVILQVGDPNMTGDAGLHYILLVDPESLETIDQTQAEVAQGRYSFQFNNIPNGTYIIAAGSDFNNDGYICDIGEACGAYLTLESPTSIQVTNDRHYLDFNTGFNVNFQSKALQKINIVPPSRGFARLK